MYPNIINLGNGYQSDFKAHFLNDNEKVEEILVFCKTAFISPKNGFLKIKDVNGEITEYILTKPKTEQELYIEDLERRLREYEQCDSTINEVNESRTNDNEEYESSTKAIGSRVSKKSK